METRVTRHADVTAVLSDPGYVVPSVEGVPHGTLAWLRDTVSRFSEGPAHKRRRRIAVEELARIDPAALQREARDATEKILAATGHDPRGDDSPDHGTPDQDAQGGVMAGDGTLDEVLAAVARQAPTAVLGRALGVTDLAALTAAVPVAAAVYLTGSDSAEADDAVATLVELLRPVPSVGTPSDDDPSDNDPSDEITANRIALLMQSCEATATLIGKAAHLALERPESAGRPVEAIIAETLRFDPPVPAMRRVTGPDADLVILDIVAANRDPDVFVDPDRFDPGRSDPGGAESGPADPSGAESGAVKAAHLTYGAGRRPCPGAEHATHLAAGVVDAIRQRFAR
jgi:cytochrome P450